ncbi:Tyrosine kinase catalytic domain protein [Ceratobasidium sp. AG-Ba]|nr:Tyrosine kinase catalytic domain protein [Ceratobasidium sp. AG-Ba]
MRGIATPNRPEPEMPIGDERSDQLWALLNRCWARNPMERPSASEVGVIMKKIANVDQEEPWDMKPKT